jgi:hypothetical protein
VNQVEWDRQRTELSSCSGIVVHDDGDGLEIVVYDGGTVGGLIDAKYKLMDWSSDRLDVAALALHGQPFGFTWADVDAIRGAADEAEQEARPYPSGIPEARAPFDSLADRIAALLPPREES